MITNENFMASVEKMQRIQINCDSCGKFIGFLLKYIDQSFEFSIKQSERAKVLFLASGIYCFCDLKHMNEWIDKNLSLMKKTVKKSIIEDEYAINAAKDEKKVVDGEHVHPMDLDMVEEA